MTKWVKKKLQWNKKNLSTYYVLGTVLCTLYTLLHWVVKSLLVFLSSPCTDGKRGCSKFSDLAEVIQLEVKGREVGSVSQTPSWHPYGLETLLFKTPRMYFWRDRTLIPSKETPCRGHKVSEGSYAEMQGRKGSVLAGACLPESAHSGVAFP